MAPPYTKIDPPVPYSDWVKTKQLFADGLDQTRTLVFNDPKNPGMRTAYGTTGVSKFWFFIAKMTGDQEAEFKAIWASWQKGQTGVHDYLAIDEKPPACGTPNTPVCPPEPDLSGAIENLAELVAGPGASDVQVAKAQRQVIDMLMSTLASVAAMIENKK